MLSGPHLLRLFSDRVSGSPGWLRTGEAEVYLELLILLPLLLECWYYRLLLSHPV